MRRSAGVAVILGLVSSILVMAPNAHATVTTVDATCDSGLGLFVFPTSVTVSETDSISIVTGGTMGGTPVAGFSIQSVPTGFSSSPAGSLGRGWTFTVSVGAGATSGSIVVSSTGGFCPSQTATIAVTVSGGSGGGGGGGSSSSDSSTPSVETSTPSVETLSLSLAASGATCTGGNPTGYAGTWLTLPSADQCTQSGPTAKSGAKLLGWATSSSFPVARAQAQVDKKWGVIDEVIDGERMIFIPGGMATFVSGSNNLFPIWSA